MLLCRPGKKYWQPSYEEVFKRPTHVLDGISGHEQMNMLQKHNGVVFFVFKGLPSTQTHDTMEVTPGGTQLHPWYLK